MNLSRIMEQPCLPHLALIYGAKVQRHETSLECTTYPARARDGSSALFGCPSSAWPAGVRHVGYRGKTGSRLHPAKSTLMTQAV
jgi:hypothetical protein